MKQKTWSIGAVSQDVAVDRTTIYNWMSKYGLEEFFSEGALGSDDGLNRKFTQSDADVINTIKVLRSNGTKDWDEIKKVLDEGTRITQVLDGPLSADGRVISVQHAEVAVEVSRLQAMLDNANEIIESKDRVIAEKDAQIGELQVKVNDLYERLTGVRTDTDVRELERTIGRLEAKIEMLQDNK